MKQANELLREANRIRNECMELVPEFAGTLRSIHFKVSSRMTRAAGSARPLFMEVTLSLPYFADDANFEEHFRETVTHEIAHILSPPVRRSNGRKSSHGTAWKRMHRRLGGKGERCHDLTLAEGYGRRTRGRSARTPVPCSCGCGETMMLGPTQLKRYERGERYVLKGHKRQVNIDDLFRF